MAIVACPQCGKVVTIANASVGKTVVGPCGHDFIAVTDPSQQPAIAPQSALAPRPNSLVPNLITAIALAVFGCTVGVLFLNVNLVTLLGLPEPKGIGEKNLVDGKDKKKDEAKQITVNSEPTEIDGEWYVVHAGSMGLPTDSLPGKKFVFTRGIVTTPQGKTGRFVVDPTRNPKWIDLSLESGELNPGIYTLSPKGDLLLCMSIPKRVLQGTQIVSLPGERPMRIEPKTANFYVLSKVDPDAKSGDARALEGGWIVEEVIIQGEKNTGNRGEPMIFMAGKVHGFGPLPIPYLVGPPFQEFTNIDFATLDGSKALGIFKIAEDKLILSFTMGNPARPRPMMPGEHGAVIYHFQRARKDEVLYSPIASKRQLRSIGLALNEFHDAHRTFPPVAISDGSGKPLLSWRVAILPYLGKEAASLYKEFNLNEPWDHPRNKKLIAKMPSVFALPFVKTSEGITHYRALAGAGTTFNPAKGPDGKAVGLSISQIADGPAQTITVVEASDPTIWTRPDDLSFDGKSPLPKLGVSPRGFGVLLADASMVFVPAGFPEDTLRRYFSGTSGIERNSLATAIMEWEDSRKLDPKSNDK